jgi:hypothetical protein
MKRLRESAPFLHFSLITSRPCRNQISRRVHVCGLLGTYSVGDTPGADDDFWMATDFVALRQLIGAHDEQSLWLCRRPIIRQRELLLGDLSCDRMVFDPPPFETLRETDPASLAIEFLVAVTEASGKLSSGDTLVVVLVGHGNTQNHAFVVGSGDGTDPGERRWLIPDDSYRHFGIRKTTKNLLTFGLFSVLFRLLTC